MEEKVLRINCQVCESRIKSNEKFFYLGQFWQQEEGQLISADVSYQMVDLCDYKNTFVSYIQYFWVSFEAKS